MMKRMIFLLFLSFVLSACKGESGGGSPSALPNPISVTSPATDPTPSPTPPPARQPLPVFQVIGVSPMMGNNVPVNQAFEITFDQPLDRSSIIVNSGVGLDTVSLYIGDVLNHEAALIAATVQGNKLIVRPRYDLLNRTTYRLVVSQAVMATNGATLASDYFLVFTTGVVPGTHPGDEITLTWTQTGFTDELNGDFIDRFYLHFGRISRHHPDFVIYDYENVQLDQSPKLNGPYEGDRRFTAILRHNFEPNTSYYFSLRSCTISHLCSPLSEEVEVNF